ncbi:restriction endonuclease [Acinetobacter baumannii]|uniref:Restriction endonuclease n=1 Tax=Acinetobacter baumannii TaxID=470 RepID=A0A1S2G0A8_ACIBA|nr:restriction endonuclease [Acinetobacter baumannii]EKU2422838.1 restriction endonuclease [Acinetobacter baumannii]EKV1719117.1 restriction endonuclease [Acinetobacter baumannii]MCE6434498.1 restriction endonuclease [Acinetobacter baumannii]MCE6822089.1 restriction endonuclease [Acinetobacter baumannii]MCE6825117.1 restriction endonuclease [Acinetobacter baumannii]
MKIITHDLLTISNLFIDCLYQGARNGNASDDPLHLLLPVSNQGGFRIVGKKTEPKLVVLTTSMNDPDWPDEVDKETGIFTYFGDNKKPGHELHDTPRYGNLLLKNMFALAHGKLEDRLKVPPILIFAKGGGWRDVVFIGLAVPGAPHLDSNSDLVAVWKLRNGNRFQNYRAQFTILNESMISREWISDIVKGDPLSSACPSSWKTWVEQGLYLPLKAPRALEYRTRDEQLPETQLGQILIKRIHSFFKEDPYSFERCAGKIAEMMLPAIAGNMDFTRQSRDGGRDAIGYYRIGEGASAVLVEFALEAKCYALESSVGVKEISRLISRLRYRQFGILVTTSFVAAQAYKEIMEDQHPIVIICASDIIKLLIRHGINDLETLDRWLKRFK